MIDKASEQIINEHLEKLAPCQRNNEADKENCDNHEIHFSPISNSILISKTSLITKIIDKIPNSWVSSEIKFTYPADKEINQDTPKFSDNKHLHHFSKRVNDCTGNLTYDYLTTGKQVIFYLIQLSSALHSLFKVVRIHWTKLLYLKSRMKMSQLE